MKNPYKELTFMNTVFDRLTKVGSGKEVFCCVDPASGVEQPVESVRSAINRASTVLRMKFATRLVDGQLIIKRISQHD